MQYLFEDIQHSVSDWFISMSTLPEQRALSGLRNDILQQLKPLKPYQQNYVEQITVSTDSVKRFYATYCEKDDINPNFSGTKRAQLCHTIMQSSLMRKPQ
ncbi:hypothetical protein [Alteromonas sp. RW2A1]|uniref:hypothetical protein n=1 Tax=Alteromonas sp. RW2A1 TaxID=1917158 RepID=UPI001E58857B|nr:hypothetical protein [Alteromonas sp. RW2A1]